MFLISSLITRAVMILVERDYQIESQQKLISSGGPNRQLKESLLLNRKPVCGA